MGSIHVGICDSGSGLELLAPGCPGHGETSVSGLGREQGMGKEQSMGGTFPSLLSRTAPKGQDRQQQPKEVTPEVSGLREDPLQLLAAARWVRKEQSWGSWVLLTSASASPAGQQLLRALFLGFQESWDGLSKPGRELKGKG